MTIIRNGTLNFIVKVCHSEDINWCCSLLDSSKLFSDSDFCACLDYILLESWEEELCGSAFKIMCDTAIEASEFAWTEIKTKFDEYDGKMDRKLYGYIYFYSMLKIVR
jgi:hypothetical protein